MQVCQDIDGSNWLEADLRISCDDDTYRSYTIVGGIAMAIYPFGIPLLFVAILARHSADLYLDEDLEARKVAVEKQLEDRIDGRDDDDETRDEEHGAFHAAGVRHDEQQAQQKNLALQAELDEMGQAVERHQRTVQMYGFIFAQYGYHAWYWEAGVLCDKHTPC